MSDTATDAASSSVAAIYFDGRSAHRHAVRLMLDGETLHMRGDSATRSQRLADLRISEPMGAAPRLITFADGSYCEVRDHAALAHLLAASGHRDRTHIRWQFDARMVLVSVAAFVTLCLAAYFVGLPVAAEIAAPAVPDAVNRTISEQTLKLIDDQMMAPSKLPAERTEPIVTRFAAMRTPDGAPVAHRVLFRDGGRFGANAFALPDGTLVVTDQLVSLAAGDDQILAVLSHELGHAAQHHGLRLVLQGSLVGLFLTWYVGDVSNLLAAAPAALLQARYSRGMESDADTWGAAMLRANGMAPTLLADALERLEAAHPPRAGGMPEYLSSHPETEARIRALRGAR